MRIFHVAPDRFVELQEIPAQLPATGFVWIGSARREFEVATADIQAARDAARQLPSDLHSIRREVVSVAEALQWIEQPGEKS